jgi:hypothetical protein
MAANLQHHSVGLTWAEPGGMARAAHAVLDGERVWWVDPFDDAAALTAAAELGRPTGILQLLDRHNRDCEQLAKQFGVPLLRLPERVPDAPFEVVRVVWRPWWHEIALWWPQQRTLIVAEAVGTAPAFALGGPAGVHPMLRLRPPRDALSRHRPDRLLVGHGNAIETGGGEALDHALAHARADIPRLLLKAPTLLRGG